jgi:hypothetical protein
MTNQASCQSAPEALFGPLASRKDRSLGRVGPAGDQVPDARLGRIVTPVTFCKAKGGKKPVEAGFRPADRRVFVSSTDGA